MLQYFFVALFFTGHFPVMFEHGQGLTGFKVNSKYLITAILLAALITIVKFKITRSIEERALLSAAIVFTICAEFSFTFYVDVDGRAESENQAKAHFLSSMSHELRTPLNTILEFVKLDSGQTVLKIEKADVSKTTSESLKLCSLDADQHHIKIINLGDQHDDLYASIDAMRLREVLDNMLSNAINYNVDEGSITINCQKNDRKHE